MSGTPGEAVMGEFYWQASCRFVIIANIMASLFRRQGRYIYIIISNIHTCTFNYIPFRERPTNHPSDLGEVLRIHLGILVLYLTTCLRATHWSVDAALL